METWKIMEGGLSNVSPVLHRSHKKALMFDEFALKPQLHSSDGFRHVCYAIRASQDASYVKGFNIERGNSFTCFPLNVF